MNTPCNSADRGSTREWRWQRSISALSQTWIEPKLISGETEQRVGVFERALQKGVRDAAEAERLFREITMRRELWLRRWDSVVWDHDLINAFNVLTSKQEDAAFAMLLWTPFLWIWFSLRSGAGFGTTARLRRALRTGDCPDCGSTLFGRTAFPQIAALSIVGPRVCWECGSPWPLVPPPNAGEPVSIAEK